MKTLYPPTPHNLPSTMQLPFSPIRTDMRAVIRKAKPSGPHCNSMQCQLEFVIKMRVFDMCRECMAEAIRMYAELMFSVEPEIVYIPCLPGVGLWLRTSLEKQGVKEPCVTFLQ